MRAAAAAALLLLVRAPAGGLTSVSVATGTGTVAAAETGATGIGARDSLPGRVDRLGVYFQNVTHRCVRAPAPAVALSCQLLGCRAM